MPERVEKSVGRMLRDRGLTLAVAESCTGGLICHRLTQVPGCSGYFLGGAIAYSNAVKIALLGVAAKTLARDGAVSRRTAREMARGARRAFEADAAVAVTGIAGPGGGSKAKPVGLVYLPFTSRRRATTRRVIARRCHRGAIAANRDSGGCFERRLSQQFAGLLQQKAAPSS